MPFRSGKRFEQYTIHCVLGRGNEGGVVYRALHDEDTERDPVALKHPVRSEEQQALRALHERAPDCPGVAPLLDWGEHYVVTELLGPPIKMLFRELEDRPLSSRWEVIRTLGKVLLRSLEAVHRCGLVHCDVQPSNILLGRTRGGLAQPFLIDFGCARTYPGGEPMQGDWGSIDFNSASSADGGVRGPHDDLESLGWVLCHGLFGELPWFEWTRNAWESGEWKRRREGLAKRVQRAKAAACEKGWGRLGPSWKHLNQMPQQLQDYLCTCYRRRGEPDYDALASMLHGSDAADEEPTADAQCFDMQVSSLLNEGGYLDDVGMRVKDRETVRSFEGVGAPWQRLAALKLAAALEAAAAAAAAAAGSWEQAAASSAEHPEATELIQRTGAGTPPGTPRSSCAVFDFRELEATHGDSLPAIATVGGP